MYLKLSDALVVTSFVRLDKPGNLGALSVLVPCSSHELLEPPRGFRLSGFLASWLGTLMPGKLNWSMAGAAG